MLGVPAGVGMLDAVQHLSGAGADGLTGAGAGAGLVGGPLPGLDFGIDIGDLGEFGDLGFGGDIGALGDSLGSFSGVGSGDIGALGDSLGIGALGDSLGSINSQFGDTYNAGPIGGDANIAFALASNALMMAEGVGVEAEVPEAEVPVAEVAEAEAEAGDVLAAARREAAAAMEAAELMAEEA